MADPLSVVLNVGGFAFKASTTLHELIRSLRSQNRSARALKDEVGDLSEVLASLLQTIASNPELDFQTLELPLRRCGHACDEYRKIIERCTQHSTDGSRPSVRDWITQKYLQGDIDEFKTMIAVHKSTINIALAHTNLRITAVTPEALENYKDLITDTTTDLDSHMNSLQEKIDRLQSGDAAAVDDVALEWQSMLEEKESTERGLEMCATLSAQIARFESASKEHARFSSRPSAQKHIKKGLGAVETNVQSLVSELKSHEATISSQLEALTLHEGLSEPVAAQINRLQQAKESISQCVQIVSEAKEAADDRSNVFEDITLTENSYAFSVSTVGDLVMARRLDLKGRSRHFAGQMTDETVQQAMAALTQLDRDHLEHNSTRAGSRVNTDSQSTGDAKYFHNRFGPGQRAG